MTEVEQAVIIRVLLSDQFGRVEEIESIHEMEGKIAQLLIREKVGILDGDDLGEGHCIIYLYGQDADKIAAVINPVLTGWQALKGGTVTRRYGPLGSEQTVTKY